ncbi:unnamed protein product [Malus baccata var. baccata]
MTGFVRTRSERVTYPLDDRVKDRLVGGYSSGPSDASKVSDHSGDYDSPYLSELVRGWVSYFSSVGRDFLVSSFSSVGVWVRKGLFKNLLKLLPRLNNMCKFSGKYKLASPVWQGA